MPHKTRELKKYVIDLAKPGAERWNEVITDHAYHFQPVMDEIDKILKYSGLFGTLAPKLTHVMAKMGTVKYHDEILSISKLSGFPLGKLVLMQICYEMFAACTSVVIKNGNYNIHYRTMDWEMEFLKPLTIEVEFVRGDQHLFNAITWAGYVGIFTGVNSLYSLAVNYRRSNGTLLGNVKRALSMKWPVGYLLRDILENGDRLKIVKHRIYRTQLIAPCYVTICPRKLDAVIAVRDCDKLVEKRHQADGLLVQTNHDEGCETPLDNIMWSFERYHKASHYAQKFSRQTTTGEDTTTSDKNDAFIEFNNGFYSEPIINDHTIYSAVMIPYSGTLKGQVHG